MQGGQRDEERGEGLLKGGTEGSGIGRRLWKLRGFFCVCFLICEKDC